MLEQFITAVFVVGTPEGLFLIVTGCVVAFMLGVLPGLSSTEGMIIMLPFTFSLGLDNSMLLLCSAYASGFVGGAVTSIVLGIPGTSTGLATIIDGHPFHRQGRSFYAMSVAATASMSGGLLSLALVVILLPFMQPISLLFGPVEWFAFVLFGLVMLSFVGETGMLRGLFSAGFGLLVGTIGMSVVTAYPRYTFGITDLWGGIPIVAAFIGLYPLTEAVYMTVHGRTPQRLADGSQLESKNRRRQTVDGAVDTFRHGGTLSLSALSGWVIGVIPGVGATFANLMTYLMIKGLAKDKSRFGKGDIRGLIAAEAANNASVGGALIPALALGIPGSLNSAILLGVFLINGVQPGSNIFAENLHTTWVILISAAAGTMLSSALVIIIGGRLIKIVAFVRQTHIVPIIVFIGCLAVLLSRSNPFDLVIAFVLAGVGLVMKHFRLSRVSFVIALMLSGLIESSFTQGLSIGRGSAAVFFDSTIANVLWVGIVACLLLNLRGLKFLRRAVPEQQP